MSVPGHDERDLEFARQFELPVLEVVRPPEGTPGLEHRIGGLEKADGSGSVSYDPINHERMTQLRHEKVATAWAKYVQDRVSFLRFTGS